MRRRDIDELKWLERMAGIPLQTKGLRAGRQCLICRCWKEPCGACRGGAGAPPVPGRNGKRRPDLDERIREMLRASAAD